MTWGLIVKENNQQLFVCLKSRLSVYYPDIYIVNSDKINDSNILNLTDRQIYITNNRDFSLNSNEIPLFNNNTIDCKRIKSAIDTQLSSLEFNYKSHFDSFSKCHLLVSYTYINEREKYIEESFSKLKDISDYPIRIDLMAGIRMHNVINSGLSSGSLTELLKSSMHDDFTSESILNYLNPDSLGFLSPGKPQNSDDVFDAGIKNISKLLFHLRKLTYESELNISSLVVTEGFKTSDMLSIIKHFDTIHFLIPSKLSEENLGISEVVKKYNQQLSNNQRIQIHYLNGNKTNDQANNLRT